MNDLYIKVAKKVREAREAKGLSLHELGKRCNMDYSNISRLEQGNRAIRLTTLKIIADDLGVDVKDFL